MTTEQPGTVGDALDKLGSVADALDQASASEFDDADREFLAAVIAQLDEIVTTLSGVASEAQRQLIALMESDTEIIGPWLVERSERSSTTWDGERARSAITQEIVSRVATNPETGEIIMPIAGAVREALRLAYTAVSSAPKASMNIAGLRALGLNGYDYSTTKRNGYRLKVSQP